MTTLFFVEPELWIALNRTLEVFYPRDNVIFKSVEIPESLPLAANSNEKTPENIPECTKLENTDSAKEPTKIQQICYAPNRQIVALTTSGENRVLIYRCRPEHAWLVSTRALARTSTALTFSSDSESLLVTDETGDCYLYDCVNLEAPPKGPLFGHLCIVSDVLWTEDKKYIITCDRDDKIRVTNYPETCDIHGYCLGHKEFVSGIRFLGNDNTIVSISGDKTLRIWNYESCEELLKVDLPGAAIRFDVQAIDDNKYETAILHQLDNCVSLYSLEKDGDGAWHAKEIGLHRFDDFTACNACLGEGRLYVTGVVNEKFVLKLIPISSDRPPPEQWLDMVNDRFKQYNWIPENLTTWFKKRYDNVSENLERKKRRIDVCQ